MLIHFTAVPGPRKCARYKSISDGSLPVPFLMIPIEYFMYSAPINAFIRGSNRRRRPMSGGKPYLAPFRLTIQSQVELMNWNQPVAEPPAPALTVQSKLDSIAQKIIRYSTGTPVIVATTSIVFREPLASFDVGIGTCSHEPPLPPDT
ncbi:hypothetical protein D3C75_640480 [compost metagenome]